MNIGRQYTDAEVMLWYKLYEDYTLSAKRVSGEVGVKHETMLRHFRRLGLKLRPVGFKCNNIYGKEPQENNYRGYKWFYTFAYIPRAKRKKLEFTLTLAEFVNIVTSNCSYCGKSYTTETRVVHKRKISMLTVDRVDSSKGYIKENCVAACKTCNTMKLNLSVPEWVNHMFQILSHLRRL